VSDYRIGIDVGGTFTDIVGLSNGRLVRRKILSTPDDFSHAVLEGLRVLLEEAGASGQAVQEVIHGTTVATNAIVEKKGARTGLLTTYGFRDVLEIGRLRTPRLYDLTWRKPPPLVPRELRREIKERVMVDGTVFRPLDEDSVRRATDTLLRKGVASIAICCINAFANPAHEQRIAEMVRAMAPHILLSVSHQLLPEMREYERTSTTVINAYIRPVVDSYLAALERGLNAMAVEAPLLMMQSSGGIMSAPLARERPIYIVESGPAAGVMGSLHLGRRLGHQNIISFDMGGTTAKAATIQRGEVSRHSEYEVGGDLHMGHHLLRGGGYLLRVPSIELAEIGAGGGSIIWVDAGGVLQVGPHSAGARPGPACYATGGTAPTVTDANVLLGYLNPAYLVGGELQLDAVAARRAIEAQIARPLAIDTTEAAYGAYLVANSRMIRAVRAVTSEQGCNPADFVLYAFGGGGPVHAVDMARQLHIKEVVVPPTPGLFSSLGLLFTDVEHHYVQTLWRNLPQDLDSQEANHALQRLEDEALIALRREGFPRERVQLIRHADMRYKGQKYELLVPLPSGSLTPADVGNMVERFHQEHQRTFGYRSEEQVQLVNIRLIARGVPATPRMPDRLESITVQPSHSSRRAYFGPAHGWRETPVISRQALPTAPCPGPLIVEEYDATTVVPPGAVVRVDQWGNIVITLE
jgi:N-methylhydantoinase A